MKKIVSICLVALLAIPVIAAEPKEDPAKRDYSEWLPAAGDISLGISVDLDPLAKFIGNMFNDNTNNSWEFGDIGGSALHTNQLSIMGKYMITDNLGLRANIGFGFHYNREREYVIDDAALFLDPFSRAKVIDTHKTNTNGGSFAVGVDYHVGKRAVQGIFGGGVVYGLNIKKSRYEYGNGITDINQNPTAAFGSCGDYFASAGMPHARILKGYNSTPTHFFGLYGNVGIEWFVAPKIALGANVNVNLVYSFGAQEYIDVEGWNIVTEEVETFTELVAPGDHGFSFSIDNVGANLYVAFYF